MAHVQQRVLVSQTIYDNTKDVSSGVVTNLDWNDGEIRGKESFLISAMSEDEIEATGKAIIPMLVSGISEIGIVSLIQLAYNIVAPGSTFRRIYPTANPCALINSQRISTLSATILTSTGNQATITWPQKLKTCQACTYIAGSLMRLFNKDRLNYMRAWPQIKASYTNFYFEDFPLPDLDVQQAVIDDIHRKFHGLTRYKYSIAGHLHEFEALTEHKGLLKMLFELHLQNTGMHCWPLFHRAVDVTGLSAEELMDACHHNLTKKALLAIKKLIDEFEAPDAAALALTDRARKTYKYARLFDEKFFTPLQTKNCVQLTLILANIAQMGGKAGQGDIMQMAALVNIPQDVKDKYRNVAKNIYDYALTSDAARGGNPMFENI